MSTGESSSGFSSVLLQVLFPQSLRDLFLCVFYLFCYVCFSDERQGSLRLNNLTNQMSGKYVCRAFNSAGSDSCSISLEVVTCTCVITTHTHTHRHGVFYSKQQNSDSSSSLSIEHWSGGCSRTGLRCRPHLHGSAACLHPQTTTTKAGAPWGGGGGGDVQRDQVRAWLHHGVNNVHHCPTPKSTHLDQYGQKLAKVKDWPHNDKRKT